MNDKNIAAIIGSILNKNDAWDISSQNEISSITFPEQLLGARKDLLKGDIYREWGRWFIEQFIDVKYFSQDIIYPTVWVEVNNVLERILGWDFDYEKKKYLSHTIAKYVIERVSFIKQQKRRRKVTRKDKDFLLSLYDKQPRCWLTGLPFSEEAIENFRGYKELKPKLPKYIDQYLPIGIIEQHLAIEVDHLYPFTYGGDDDVDNYKLICGWANRVKSSQISLYMRGTGSLAKNNAFFNLDNYYWALRVIGMKRKCEHPGCTAHIETSPLTISSYHGEGKLINPISMRVLCYDHASEKDRFIKREAYLN
jgi:hypothetical protein